VRIIETKSTPDEGVSLKDLRDIAAQTIKGRAHAPWLKSFAVVGAPVIGSGIPSNIDEKRLSKLIGYLCRSGVPVDPDFEVDNIDFLCGRHFLREDRQYDVTLLSYVPRKAGGNISGTDITFDQATRLSLNPVAANIMLRFQQYLKAGDLEAAFELSRDAGRWVSDFESEKDWSDRLALSKSKLVFSIYKGCEVDLRILSNACFAGLGNPRSEGYHWHPNNITDLMDPVGDWQGAASLGYIDQIAQIVTGNTVLSNAIRDTALQRLDLELGVPVDRRRAGLPKHEF